MIGLVALLACGLAVTQPCLAALLPAMVRPDDLPRASAISQTAGSLGALAGPALAGLLVGAVRHARTAADRRRAATCAGGGRACCCVPGGAAERPAAGGDRRHRAAAARPGGCAGTRCCSPWWSALAVVIGAIGGINVVEVFFIRETLDGSTTMYGLVDGRWMAGMLAGGWLVRPAGPPARPTTARWSAAVLATARPGAA